MLLMGRFDCLFVLPSNHNLLSVDWSDVTSELISLLNFPSRYGFLFCDHKNIVIHFPQSSHCHTGNRLCIFMRASIWWITLSFFLKHLYFLLCSILKEIGWFDQTENQAGALTALLATEATKVSMVSGSELGLIVGSIILIVMSLIVSFIYSWQLTLVMMAFAPILAVSGMLFVSGSYVLIKSL